MIRAVLTIVLFLAGIVSPAHASDVGDVVSLPDGFAIKLYADAPEARSLVPVPALGAVIVGQRKGSRIHAIVDRDLDGTAEDVVILRRGLKSPNGIDWRDGYLYVAEQHRLIRLKGDTLAALAEAEPEVLFDGFPDDPWHGWRYARFAPDGSLYVSVGAPCNICSVDGLEGTIVRFDPETWKPEVYASGVRNSVGFAFQPGTGDLFFTDNGADNMGDDSPPDELNHAPVAGSWFGFPYFGGGADRTSDFSGRPLPRNPIYPVVEFGAHVAALGISFYEGDMFPRAFSGDAFVAQHGSWNRTIPDGYRVVRVRFENGRAVGYEHFAEGFLLPDGSTWGRPVDIKPLPDGSLLVSDDRRDAVYRITHARSGD